MRAIEIPRHVFQVARAASARFVKYRCEYYRLIPSFKTEPLGKGSQIRCNLLSSKSLKLALAQFGCAGLDKLNDCSCHIISIYWHKATISQCRNVAA